MLCRSVATSASDGSCCSRATSFGTQVANSSEFGLVSMNWYCVGLTVESIVRSCTDCMNSEMPVMFATRCCRSRMICAAVSERSSRAFRLISIRPLFSVMLLPSTPMNDVRLSTFGSFRISAASACWRSAIAPYEIDCGACVIAWITPVSCAGKKPFGT